MYAKIVEWFKNKFFPKTKEFFKKYWGYIVTFLVGLFSALGINAARNNRARKNISELERELEQYASLNKRLEEYTNELELKLSELGELSDAARQENKQLRDIIAESERDITSLRLELATTKELANGAEDVTERISAESAKVGEGISRLGEFLNKYGAQASDL